MRISAADNVKIGAHSRYMLKSMRPPVAAEKAAHMSSMPAETANTVCAAALSAPNFAAIKTTSRPVKIRRNASAEIEQNLVHNPSTSDVAPSQSALRGGRGGWVWHVMFNQSTGTVTIHGSTLTASQNTSTAIGIAAPWATSVTLNGQNVPFTISGGCCTPRPRSSAGRAQDGTPDDRVQVGGNRPAYRSRNDHRLAQDGPEPLRGGAARIAEIDLVVLLSTPVEPQSVPGDECM